jgi:hypothetical protein
MKILITLLFVLGVASLVIVWRQLKAHSDAMRCNLYNSRKQVIKGVFRIYILMGVSFVFFFSAMLLTT